MGILWMYLGVAAIFIVIRWALYFLAMDGQWTDWMFTIALSPVLFMTLLGWLIFMDPKEIMGKEYYFSGTIRKLPMRKGRVTPASPE